MTTTEPGFRVDWSKAEILCTFCGGSLATEGEDEASAVASVSSYHYCGKRIAHLRERIAELEAEVERLQAEAADRPGVEEWRELTNKYGVSGRLWLVLVGSSFALSIVAVVVAARCS